MKADRKLIAALVAEFVGTFGLTMAVLSINRYGIPFFTAIVAGVTLATFVAVLGPVSGGYFNPAITAAVFVMRRLDLVRAVGYVLFQGLAGFAAWQLYNYLTGRPLEATSAAFNWKIFIAEALGALVFAHAVWAAITRKLDGIWAGVYAGAGLFLGATLASVASAGILNPAVALGARSLSYEYAFGPILGAVLGMAVYQMLSNPPGWPKALMPTASAPRRGRPAGRRK